LRRRTGAVISKGDQGNAIIVKAIVAETKTSESGLGVSFGHELSAEDGAGVREEHDAEGGVVRRTQGRSWRISRKQGRGRRMERAESRHMCVWEFCSKSCYFVDWWEPAKSSHLVWEMVLSAFFSYRLRRRLVPNAAAFVISPLSFPAAVIIAIASAVPASPTPLSRPRLHRPALVVTIAAPIFISSPSPSPPRLFLSLLSWDLPLISYNLYDLIHPQINGTTCCNWHART